MEPDRFQQNHKYYIIGILCLVTGLSLFALSIYIVPYLALDWHYTIPDFIMTWLHFVEVNYDVGTTAASWFIFLLLFLPALILVIVADILSNRIDNQIYGIEPVKKTNKNRNIDNRESKSLIFRIIVIIIFVFIAAKFFQWAISTPSI